MSRKLNIRDPVKDKKLSLQKQNTRFAVFITLPGLIIVGVFLYYPIFNAILMGFQNVYFGKGEYDWVGFKNFIRIFEKPHYFLDSFWWTLSFGAISTILLFIIGMYFALLINRDMPGRNIFRGILLLPWAIPWFINAYLWLWLFDVQFGLINYILKSLDIIDKPINWIGGVLTAKIAVIIAYLYRVFPFNMLVYLAGFQTIDPVYYEAAEIDGASKIRQFLHITLPQLRGLIIFTALLNFIWSFQEFETIWIMTKGGPIGTTSTLLIKIYTLAFQDRQFSAAAAYGILWIIFLIIFSIIYLRVLLFRGETK